MILSRWTEKNEFVGFAVSTVLLPRAVREGEGESACVCAKETVTNNGVLAKHQVNVK